MSVAWAITVNGAAATLVLAAFSKSAAFAVAVHHAIYFVALVLGVVPPAITPATTLAWFVFAPAAAAWLGALLGHLLSITLDLARVLIDVREPAAPRRLLERVPYTLVLLVGVAAIVLGVSQAIAGTASSTAIAVALLFGVLFTIAGAAGLVLVFADVSTLVHALAAIVIIAVGTLVFNAALASAAVSTLAAAGYTALALLLTYLVIGALFVVGTGALHLAAGRVTSIVAWTLLYLMAATIYVVGALAATSTTSPANPLVVVQYLFVAFWVWVLLHLAIIAYGMYTSGAWAGYDLLAPLDAVQPAYFTSFTPAAAATATTPAAAAAKTAARVGRTVAATRIEDADLAVFDRMRAAQKGVGLVR